MIATPSAPTTITAMSNHSDSLMLPDMNTLRCFSDRSTQDGVRLFPDQCGARDGKEEELMTVQIQVTSTEEAGTTATVKGEELLWNVRLALEYRGTSNFTIPLDFRIVGPAGAEQAKEAAYAELRRFLNEAIAEVGTRGTVS